MKEEGLCTSSKNMYLVRVFHALKRCDMSREVFTKVALSPPSPHPLLWLYARYGLRLFVLFFRGTGDNPKHRLRAAGVLHLGGDAGEEGDRAGEP